ncbi:hypothetical protein [Williamsia sp. DF01-3]|uniref:hypothetical protein n=1 Tax=Williamsia sp. DF01-3 TaxID=2934157 RepID=UPI000DB5AF55|nr:hypothetical protein [Williamsia sp. DF01-3]MCK0515759.1 hypothetical protein [Williamsia sp. DF01-3]PZU02014.1 MAG: hypothetical protein DI630_10060 [Gordonia sp. (in: high G+C Gram-positive bacteria)]
MTTTHTPTRRSATARLTVAAVAFAITASLMAGCSSEDGEPTATTTTRTPAQAQQWDPNDPPRTIEPTAATPSSALPDAAAELDRSNPDAVSKTAVQIWFSWDTATDRGPNDATARAASLLTKKFADSLFATGSNSPGGQWLTWAEQDAVVTPTIRLMPDQGAPQTPDRKYYVYEVTQIARTPDGEQVGAPVTTSAWVICVRNGPIWEVSQLAQR